MPSARKGKKGKKICAARSTKDHLAYTKPELVKMAIKKGLKGTKARAMPKPDLCKYLKMPYIIKAAKKTSSRKKKAPEKKTVKYGIKRSAKKTVKRVKPPQVDLVKKSPLKHQISIKPVKTSAALRSPISRELSCVKRSKLPLREHQKRIVEFMMKNRGLIVNHKMGAGKTLTAVAVSQCFLDSYPKGLVIFTCPSSLVANFKKEMINYGIKDSDKRYDILSYNMFAKKYADIDKFDRNVLFIVDEAHNFRKDIKTAERAAAHIKVKKGTVPVVRAAVALNVARISTKVLLLTGTAMYNSPYDIANLVAMIWGRFLTQIDLRLILGDDSLFNKYFKCTFSFYDPGNVEDYPKRVDKVVKFEMTRPYYDEYRKVEKAKSTLFKKESMSFLTGVRQASNAIKICLKCAWIVDKIKENRMKKTLIFSSFRDYGTEMVKDALIKNQIKYVEISGSTTQKNRIDAVKRFNNDEFQVIIITKAGSEGLDLKGIENVIILESGWNSAGEEQVIGRAIRYKSHSHLPVNRRVVSVYYLMTVKPQLKDPDDNTDSADFLLRRKMVEKNELISKFMTRIASLSIERAKCMDGKIISGYPVLPTIPMRVDDNIKLVLKEDKIIGEE